MNLQFEYDTRQIKFVQETSTSYTKINDGDFVVLDADLVYEEDLVLDASELVLMLVIKFSSMRQMQTV